MVPFSWKCPFCNHDSVITEESYHFDYTILQKKNSEGTQWLSIYFIVCPNKDCKKYSLSIKLFKAEFDEKRREFIPKTLIKEWNLIPQSEAKPFPKYVPKAILSDYNEASLIRDLSPKASATLSRRCLQTMIRDFWDISGLPNLKQEMDAIKEKVDSITWNAIDNVREIGNIGAHMERDINLIIDVESGEAKLLIQLIEYLIKEWYVSRYEREENLKKIIKIGSQKNIQKKKSKSK